MIKPAGPVRQPCLGQWITLCHVLFYFISVWLVYQVCVVGSTHCLVSADTSVVLLLRSPISSFGCISRWKVAKETVGCSFQIWLEINQEICQHGCRSSCITFPCTPGINVQGGETHSLELCALLHTFPYVYMYPFESHKKNIWCIYYTIEKSPHLLVLCVKILLESDDAVSGVLYLLREESSLQSNHFAWFGSEVQALHGISLIGTLFYLKWNRQLNDQHLQHNLCPFIHLKAHLVEENYSWQM